MKAYSDRLTNYEQQELLSYAQIYFVGSATKKSDASYSGENNEGFDDAQNAYIVISHDHIAYRYEILKSLGKGSFGQVNYSISLYGKKYSVTWHVKTRAVLSPGNRAKPCKFQYVKPMGNLIYTEDSKRQRKVAFSMTALSFDNTSPANPDECQHKTYSQKPQTVGYIFAADSVYASPCILIQSCLKNSIELMKQQPAMPTVYQHPVADNK